MTKRIHIIGHKNSGKTTLVAELVTYLTGRGVKVGTIKHTHHQHDLDTPGKDSHRHREAGAAVVGILARDANAVFWPARQDVPKADRYTAMMPLFSECDLVLVEGDSRADAPRIEVWRAATETEPFAREDPSVFALVTDDEIELQVPVWKRADVAALAERISEI